MKHNPSLHKRLCGFRTSAYKYTSRTRYAYITFHTIGQANRRRGRGFSRAEFTAEGLFTNIIYYYSND